MNFPLHRKFIRPQVSGPGLNLPVVFVTRSWRSVPTGAFIGPKDLLEPPRSTLQIRTARSRSTSGLFRMPQRTASPFSTGSTARESPVPDLVEAYPPQDTDNFQRRRSLRSYRRQTIIRSARDTSSTLNGSNGDNKEGDFQPVDSRELAISWSAKSNTTTSSSSNLNFPNETLPVIALIPPTPRGSVGSPVLPPDSPITVQKFVAARSNALLKRQPSFMSSPPALTVPSCSACSRPERLLSEDDLSCRKCRKQWLACQLWYQACDGGRMERLRVPFVRPGECNAVNRALSESLGLLPPNGSRKSSRGRVAKPSQVLGLCLSVLMKPFRGLVRRKADGSNRW